MYNNNCFFFRGMVSNADKVICIENSKKKQMATYYGDAGGPLYIYEKTIYSPKDYWLVGVTSGSTNKGQVLLWTLVGPYCEWIGADTTYHGDESR